VGNAKFAGLIENSSTSGLNLRVTHKNDAVVDEPDVAISFDGHHYEHLAPSFQIQPLSGRPVGARDILQIDDPRAPNFDFLGLLRDPNAHNSYITNIASCGELSVAAVILANRDALIRAAVELRTRFPGLVTSPFLDFILMALGVPRPVVNQLLLAAGYPLLLGEE